MPEEQLPMEFVCVLCGEEVKERGGKDTIYLKKPCDDPYKRLANRCHSLDAHRKCWDQNVGSVIGLSDCTVCPALYIEKTMGEIETQNEWIAHEPMQH